MPVLGNEKPTKPERRLEPSVEPEPTPRAPVASPRRRLSSHVRPVRVIESPASGDDPRAR